MKAWKIGYFLVAVVIAFVLTVAVATSTAQTPSEPTPLMTVSPPEG